MPNAKSGINTNTRGICTNLKNENTETGLSTSETDSEWQTPSKLKQEVQTIIDIMGPPLSPNFNYNTSSEADNEESIFSNSKISSLKFKELCESNNDSEKTDTIDVPSFKDEGNISTAAELNTASTPATMEDLTDSKVNFPYVESFCRTNQYVCPPPLNPANVCINSECFCPQVASVLHSKVVPPNYSASNYRYETQQRKNEDWETTLMVNANKSDKINKGSKNGVINWLKTIVSSSKLIDNECNNCNYTEYYKMNVKTKKGDKSSPPRRVVFELVEDLKKNIENCNINCDIIDADLAKFKKNAKNEKLQTRTDLQCVYTNDSIPESRKSRKPVEKTMCCDESGKTRVDVYYFDHGSFNHYQTTDAPPVVVIEEVAEKTEKYTTRFWAEIFGTLHIGFSFATSFILQFFRFLLYSVFRPLTIGLVQLVSDYFFKPLLVTLFNGIIQPILIFFYNIIATIRDICDPIAEGIGYFLRELAILVRAFRIVEITNENCKCQTECKCEKKIKKKIVC